MWLLLFIVIFLAIVAAGSINRRSQWKQDHPEQWAASRADRRKTVLGVLVAAALLVGTVKLIEILASLPTMVPAFGAQQVLEFVAALVFATVLLTIVTFLIKKMRKSWTHFALAALVLILVWMSIWGIYIADDAQLRGLRLACVIIAVISLMFAFLFFKAGPIDDRTRYILSASTLALSLFSAGVALLAAGEPAQRAREADEAARTAGFEDAADRDIAAKSSITDPKVWVERKAADAAKLKIRLQAAEDDWLAKHRAEEAARAAQRQAEVEAKKKADIEQLKALLKTTTALESRYDLYTRLASLDSNNRDYQLARDALAKQVEDKRRAFEKQLGEQRERDQRDREQLDHPERYVTIENTSWSKGGFDNVMITNFSIRNSSSFAVKDIGIRCDHSAPSGTHIDSNTRTIYERIEPKKSKQFTNFNMGFIHSQATRTSCAVTSAVAMPPWHQ